MPEFTLYCTNKRVVICNVSIYARKTHMALDPCVACVLPMNGGESYDQWEVMWSHFRSNHLQLAYTTEYLDNAIQ